ncbi:hypothetical protein SELMODRAFT_451614 [Selaginella moellendorffii]|uniref:Uncharacterized protein ABI3B-1 n=1 Tax=Selaginella moellendorffii TaxID=88036 RepID=D8SC60_SELML|nr:hypothetical protein SELMODRAFT_451614 [Selaginella moellendorffii]
MAADSNPSSLSSDYQNGSTSFQLTDDHERDQNVPWILDQADHPALMIDEAEHEPWGSAGEDDRLGNLDMEQQLRINHSFMQMQSIFGAEDDPTKMPLLGNCWSTEDPSPWNHSAAFSEDHHQQGNGFYSHDHSNVFVSLPPPQQQLQIIESSPLTGGGQIMAVASSSPCASTRAARKNCMARKRRPMLGTSKPGPTSVSAAAAPAPAVAAVSDVETTLPDDHTQGLQNKNLKFLLQKQLKPSDVGNLGRIVLPKKEAESRLPYLSAREGMTLAMEDMTSKRTWNLRYRFWPNNKSRMYLLENTGEFIRSHKLCEGDYLLLYKDSRNGKYVIYGKKDVSGSNEKRQAPKQQEGCMVKRSRSFDCERRKPAAPTLTSSSSSSSILTTAGVIDTGLSFTDIKQGLDKDQESFGSSNVVFDIDQFPLLEVNDLAIDEILDLVDLPS